jgi:hypothetical protein
MEVRASDTASHWSPSAFQRQEQKNLVRYQWAEAIVRDLSGV